jgi:uncharacterized membrane protein YoaT (DUF817 family)
MFQVLSIFHLYIFSLTLTLTVVQLWYLGGTHTCKFPSVPCFHVFSVPCIPSFLLRVLRKHLFPACISTFPYYFHISRSVPCPVSIFSHFHLFPSKALHYHSRNSYHYHLSSKFVPQKSGGSSHWVTPVLSLT